MLYSNFGVETYQKRSNRNPLFPLSLIGTVRQQGDIFVRKVLLFFFPKVSNMSNETINYRN